MGLFRKDKGGDDRRSAGGLMAQVFDEVSGGHFDGDSIVLSMVFGGWSYPCRDYNGSMPETNPGEYRLVMQDVTVRSGIRGEMAVTSVTIPEGVAMQLLSSTQLFGNLSVWTPRREDAQAIMRRAAGVEPLEYAGCSGYLAHDFHNFRSPGPLTSEEGAPGPMCLFGEAVKDPDDEI